MSAAAAAALPPLHRIALVDLTTPPLTTLGATLLPLLLPLVLLRLAAMFAVLSAWVCLLWLLQRRPRRGEDGDAPRFHCYPLVRTSTFVASRLALAALGFRVRVTGAEHVQEAYRRRTATAIVCNHCSYFDQFVIGASCGSYFAVARHDVAALPIIGSVLRAFGYAAVVRKGDNAPAGGDSRHSAPPGSSVTTLLAERARRTGEWKRHPPLLVFPEGTCASGHALLQFKSGGFVSGQPVLPVAIRLRAGALNPAWVWRLRPTRAAWAARLPTEAIHLMRVLSRPLNVAEVTVLPPYTPSDEEQRDAALYAANVRHAIATALGVPTEHCGTYDDAKAFERTARGGSAS